ncbi:MAG TPA: O-antigen ligase family protein [Opitutaceae bacterium]|jgi:O-antigen ligase
MPPRLALFLGLGFVSYTLFTERRRGVEAASGVFWPTLWYMVVSSRMVGIWLSTWGVPLPGGGGDATDGSIIDASFFAVLTIVGLSILARRGFRWGVVLQANPWLTALLIFMAASVIWSAYPYVSFKRYIKIVGSVSIAMVVLSNEHPMEATFTVIRRVLYVHLPMSIVCIKYFRTIGVSYDWSGSASSWQGISTSKNDLGQVAMLGLIYFFWEIKRQWKVKKWKNLHVLYLLMALHLLKGSDSSISLTAVSTSVFVMLMFFRLQQLRDRIDKARRFVGWVFAATAGFVLLIIVHSIVFFSEDSLLGKMITTFGRNITLTDRTNIWNDVYGAAKGHFLLGVGYGGFWIGRMMNIPWNARMTWVLGQAHNGYIDTFLQVGIIGVGLLAMTLVTTIPRLTRGFYDNFDFTCFRISVFLAIMYINVTESTFLRGDHHLWFITMLILWQVPPDAVPSFAPSLRRTAFIPEADFVGRHL